MLRNRRLQFHSDLDSLVQKICMDHQDKTTRYNELVKERIAQEKLVIAQKRKQREATELPLKEKAVDAPIVEEQPQDKAPEHVEQEKMMKIPLRNQLYRFLIIYLRPGHSMMFPSPPPRKMRFLLPSQ